MKWLNAIVVLLSGVLVVDCDKPIWHMFCV